MGDFGSMDNANYQNSLNEFYSQSAEGQEEFSAAQQKAAAKVAKFNEVLDTPLQTIGSVAVAKGIGKLLPRVKSGLNSAVRNLKTKIQGKVDDVGNELSNKIDEAKEVSSGPEDPGTVTEAGDPIETPDGIELQDFANLNQTAEPSLGETPEVSGAGGESAGASPPDAPEVDEFDPDLVPQGAGGRVQLNPNEAGEPPGPQDTPEPGNPAPDGNGEPASNIGDSNNVGGDSGAGDAGSGAGDGAGAGGDAGSGAGGDLGGEAAGEAAGDAAGEAAGDTALEALTAADAAQGGLDIVTDLATLGVGLGMIFGGIFGKKKPKAPPPPPPPINPTFQAGVA
jgi:hypothetical protein